MFSHLMVTPPIDGQPTPRAIGGAAGFAVSTPKQADAWHKAAGESDTTIESLLGVFGNASGSPYRTDLRDPHGNKLCATYRVMAA